MVKVIVINGSSRVDKGNTALVLEPFLAGIKQAGATVELFYSKKLYIKPCSSELSCWHKTPGRCYIQDDMQKLYPKLRQADILVLATPVYLPFPGEMQNIMNRLVPLIEPILEFKDNRTRAKFHKEVNIRKIALVSICGWWELGNFETLLRIVEEVAKDVDCEFTGAVLRPHAYLMKRNSEKTKEVNDALKQCGFELIKNGIIKDNLVKIISQPLISEKEYTIALTKEYLEIKTD